MVGPVITGIPQFTVAGVVNAVTATGFTVRGDAADRLWRAAPCSTSSAMSSVWSRQTSNLTQEPFLPYQQLPSGQCLGPATGPLPRSLSARALVCRPLGQPILGEPVAEAAVATLTPRFRWNTVAGATRYQFWIGEGRNATGEGLFHVLLDDTLAEIYPGNLKPGTTYTWAVRAGNEQGWGPWSLDRMFTTSSTIVQLPSPTILEPLDEAVGEDCLTGACSGPLSTEPTNTTCGSVSLMRRPCTRHPARLPSVTIPAGTLTSGVTYQWLVRVENSSQASAVCGALSRHSRWQSRLAWAFRHSTAPVPGQYSRHLNPTLTWQAVSGATRYDLWIDKGTSDSKVYEVVVTGTSWTVPAGTLQAGQTYWWTVIAGSADAWSKTGDIWNWSIRRKFSRRPTQSQPSLHLSCRTLQTVRRSQPPAQPCAGVESGSKLVPGMGRQGYIVCDLDCGVLERHQYDPQHRRSPSNSCCPPELWSEAPRTGGVLLPGAALIPPLRSSAASWSPPGPPVAPTPPPAGSTGRFHPGYGPAPG